MILEGDASPSPRLKAQPAQVQNLLGTEFRVCLEEVKMQRALGATALCILKKVLLCIRDAMGGPLALPIEAETLQMKTRTMADVFDAGHVLQAEGTGGNLYANPACSC